MTSFLGYVASGVSSIFEGLAYVGFTSCGNYFLGAVVTNFNFGFGSLGKRSRSESAGSEQKSYFFHE